VPWPHDRVPRDEGSHPPVSAPKGGTHRLGRDGERRAIGFQITFFAIVRVSTKSNPSRFVARQVLFATRRGERSALGALLRAEKSARAGFGLAERPRDPRGQDPTDWSLRQDGERLHRPRVDE
jgi:predicted secreted hydrolase